MSEPDEKPVALLPCPFCGAGEYRIDRHTYWTGMRSSLLSVSLRHWCAKGALLHAGMEFRAKTMEEAAARWNERATVFKPVITDQVLVPGTCTIDHKCAVDGPCNGYPRAQEIRGDRMIPKAVYGRLVRGTNSDLYPGEGDVGC